MTGRADIRIIPIAIGTQTTPSPQRCAIKIKLTMKNRISYLSLFIASLFFCKHGASQISDEYKYLMILNYLHTDSITKADIKSLFITSRSKKYSNNMNAEFNITNKIEFINIGGFRDSLKSSELGIGQDLIDDHKLYKEKYYFERFESPFLKRLSTNSTGSLYLSFSKPVGNYVTVVLGDRSPESTNVRHFGIAKTFLFIFDSSGFINRVLTHAAAYN